MNIKLNPINKWIKDYIIYSLNEKSVLKPAKPVADVRCIHYWPLANHKLMLLACLAI